jgi:hypothetical protein
MMVALVIVGVVTIIGVVIIGAIEAKRMENGKPSILSKASNQTGSKAKEQS